jgi:hypothetical protein
MRSKIRGQKRGGLHDKTQIDRCRVTDRSAATDCAGALRLTHEYESFRLVFVSKRLQVILKDPEYREIQRAARARHLSIAQWVREALEMARRRQPVGEVGKKLEAIRAAARLELPTGDIACMLAEIEKGYGSRDHP